ncbi:MAG: PspC domain-containing protein [Candidatus Paceibacterota bacterium]
MKKVINITLGSRVFAIEQDAYDALAVYLEQVKNSLVQNDDTKEIIDDIENAIAEKFIVRKKSEKLAVTLADVNVVVGEMGSPSDFGENIIGEIGDSKDTEHNSAESKRRLYRDTDSAIIAGVASGLAQYFDTDPVIVRLVFVISIFFNGLGILAYLILWLVVPVAKTTADKYAMRGERVTLKEITERVKKNIKNVDVVDIETTKNAWSRLSNFLDKLFKGLGKVILFLFSVVRYLAGILLVVGGALGVASLISVYSVLLLSDKVLFPEEVQIALETLQSSALGIVAMTSSFIMITILLIVLVVIGAGLLARRNFFTVQKVVALAVIWIISAVVAGTTSILQLEQVIQKTGGIEGRFDDSGFLIEWEKGKIYGNDSEVKFIREELEEIKGTSQD